jgi:hypothetical protein
MVRFCSKIKARPALVPWLAYLLSAYGGAVFGSSLVLFHNIDAGLWYAASPMRVRWCVCVCLVSGSQGVV